MQGSSCNHHRKCRMAKKTPSPNDNRSNTKNPNNPAHKAAQDNRANQKNPNHKPTKRGR